MDILVTEYKVPPVLRHVAIEADLKILRPEFELFVDAIKAQILRHPAFGLIEGNQVDDVVEENIKLAETESLIISCLDFWELEPARTLLKIYNSVRVGWVVIQQGVIESSVRLSMSQKPQ